jgi:hypothetical protein
MSGAGHVEDGQGGGFRGDRCHAPSLLRSRAHHVAPSLLSAKKHRTITGGQGTNSGPRPAFTLGPGPRWPPWSIPIDTRGPGT